MHILIVESDTNKRLMEELIGAGVDVATVPRDKLIKGELGVLDEGFHFVDVTRTTALKPNTPHVRVQPSYRSLLKRKY